MADVQDKESFKEILKGLSPLDVLSGSDLDELMGRIRLDHIKEGGFAFRQGDKTQENVYLMAGTLQLLSDLKEVDTVTAGSDAAAMPLAHQHPRLVSARASTEVTVIRIDSPHLNELLNHRVGSDYVVSEVGTGDGADWMTRMLQSGVFQRTPAANIQLVFMRLQEVRQEKGDVIIQQGDEGDFYYVIKQGRCEVTRVPQPGMMPVRLNELATGDPFGEEALVADKPRSTSISMLTDGVLLRLGKDDFVELIKNPVLRPLTYKQALDRIDGGALWLDIRERETYERHHLEGSLNLPIAFLRLQAKSLAPGQQYICYCDDGRKSAAASYLLTERGFDTYLLDGGLEGINKPPPKPKAKAAPRPQPQPEPAKRPDAGPAAPGDEPLIALELEDAPLEGLEEELEEEIIAGPPPDEDDPLQMLRDELEEMHAMRQSAEKRANGLQMQLTELRKASEIALQEKTEQIAEMKMELELLRSEVEELEAERDQALKNAK